MDVLGWPDVFRGSAAIAAGLVTPGRLRGRTYERLHPDIYRRRTAAAPSFAELSFGAGLLVEGHGVVSGYSAAELLGAGCAPRHAPAEVTVTHRVRAQPRLRVHRDTLEPADIVEVDGLLVTSAQRTAYDLARWHTHDDGVVAVDMLANKGGFEPADLATFLTRYPGARGSVGVPAVLADADRRSGSPPESRLRLLLHQAGLPRLEAQWAVQDEETRTAVWLDLAYPDHMIGIEYEGEQHTEPEAVLRDVGRYTRLVDKGWRIYRYTKYEIRDEPERIVGEIRRALGHRPPPWIAELAQRTRAAHQSPPHR
jgi:very-short-patch-repair endonuclease